MSTNSEIAQQLAYEVKNRLLGNADIFKILRRQERPRKFFVTGVIYPRTRAVEVQSYRDYKSKVTPNSYSVEIAVKGKTANVKVTPSFWVWFEGRDHPDLIPIYEQLADDFSDETLWTDWLSARRAKQEKYLHLIGEILRIKHEEESMDEEESEVDKVVPENETDPEDYFIHPKELINIRKRFAETHLFQISTEGTSERNPKFFGPIELDFEGFRKTWKDLGTSPRWAGQVMIKAWYDRSQDISRITVTVENTYPKTEDETKKEKGRSRLFREPCWFDARLRLNADVALENIRCEELDESVKAITINCISDYDRNSTAGNNELAVEQIGTISTPRLDAVPSVTFDEFSNDPVEASRLVLKHLKSLSVSEHLVKEVESALLAIQKDNDAVRSLSSVSEVLESGLSIANARWHLFQIVSLLVGVGRYLDSQRELCPIVENVPTAKGKTEAFISLMLFAAFYERLRDRTAVNIVKYPYRMLSTDQRTRIARYMIFAETVAMKYELQPLILGYFAGRTRAQDTSPEEVLGTCPVQGCGLRWKTQKRYLDRDGVYQMECPKKHILYLAMGDNVFNAAPAIIIATPDKFVAKCTQKELGNILGSLNYRCERHGYTTSPICKICKSDLSHNSDQIKVGFWCLDESHMIREDLGSLDAHYEKAHVDIASMNTRQKPIPILSTATISGIDAFSHNLGFEKPIIIPEESDKRKFFEEVKGNNRIQHVVVAIEPRDRAVVFALGRVIADWASALEAAGVPLGRKSSTAHPRSHLSQMMLYFPSHDKLGQTEEAIHNNVNRERDERGSTPLTYIRVTGQLQDDQIGLAVKQINQRDQDLVLATQIASLGIDIKALNCIAFYGMPSSVSEFVQVVNRTGREMPGIVFLVLDPGKERDRTYYDYLQLFLTGARSALIEEIPINRFARNAIKYTFSSIVCSLLLFYYSPKNSRDYRLARNVLDDLQSGELQDSEIIDRLKVVYSAKDDESGQYEILIQGRTPDIPSLWEEFKGTLRAHGVVRIWDWYFRDNIPYRMPQSLRSITQKDVLASPDYNVVRAKVARLLAVRTTSGEDVTETAEEEASK